MFPSVSRSLREDFIVRDMGPCGVQGRGQRHRFGLWFRDCSAYMYASLHVMIADEVYDRRRDQQRYWQMLSLHMRASSRLIACDAEQHKNSMPC